jgi:hypothetical protein
MRRRNILAALKALVRVAHVIADDEQDVGPFRVGCSEQRAEGNESGEEEQAMNEGFHESDLAERDGKGEQSRGVRIALQSLRQANP